MNREPLLIGLGVLALLAALGLYWWQRPAAVATAPIAAAAPVASTPVFTGTQHDNGFGELVPVQLTESKARLARLYRREDIAEFYQEDISDNESEQKEGTHAAALPPCDYAQSLAGKSYLDLLLLRNELYARNGYCFMNSTLRNHFDRRPWYRPVWAADSSAVPVPLTRQEAAFARQIHTQELALLAHRVAPQGGYPMVGVDYVVNQREHPLTPAWRAGLARHNFAIVPTREEQLFYLYDQNEYSYTPNFVTADLFLQLLHKYLNGILSDVEEQRLAPIVGRMLRQATT